MDQKKIGGFLKELRKEIGITQEQLAEKLGVSGRTVSRWENGNNMPDISLLTDIAELYDVSIPEIIDGERKSEKMNDEVKNVAEKMSDYAGSEKEKLLKEVRKMSIMGVIALIAYEVLVTTGLDGSGIVGENLTKYFHTLMMVMILILPFYTTGLIEKIRSRQKEGSISKLSKPVRIVLATVVAFVAAVIIKIFCSTVFGV